MSRPSKYRHTDITDRLIRNAYASPEYATQRGRAVKSLAEKLGWPRYIIRRRALAIGAVQLHRKEPPWTDAELDLLEQHAHKVPDVIARIFRKHGYARTATAISVKTKRVGLLTRQSLTDAELLDEKKRIDEIVHSRCKDGDKCRHINKPAWSEHLNELVRHAAHLD